jgi:GntR family transcriptional regulator, transcriptional repressor for pyruvate dehydrogenase complex
LDKPERSPFTPVKQGNLAELVVSQIKSLIFSKGIRVDQKLPPERELAERLNVSRSAVREALRSLAHAGLIEIRRGRAAGAYVVDHLYKPLYDSTTDLLRSGKIEIRQFLEARMAIECFAIRLALVRAGEEDLQKLETINDELVNGTGGVSRLLENNSRFHVALAELSGNDLITMMLRSLMKLMEDMGFNSSEPPTSKKIAHASHAGIVEALRRKDLPLCEDRLASNIALSKELRLRYVSTGGRPRRPRRVGLREAAGARALPKDESDKF